MFYFIFSKNDQPFKITHTLYSLHQDVKQSTVSCFTLNGKLFKCVTV